MPDMLYIGVPFSCWPDQPSAAIDKFTTQVFQAEQFRIYAINARINASFSVPYGESGCFIDGHGKIPGETFLEDEVYWEDFSLLYISAGASAQGTEYDRYVTRAVIEAISNGLFVCADLRGRAGDAPWAERVTIGWSDEDKIPESYKSCKIFVSVRSEQVQVITGCGSWDAPGTDCPERFMGRFLKDLMMGKSLEEIVTDTRR